MMSKLTAEQDIMYLVSKIRESIGRELWCVCWFGEIEDVGWTQHKGPPCEKAEAERRMVWGLRTYPQIIYWLEPAD